MATTSSSPVATGSPVTTTAPDLVTLPNYCQACWNRIPPPFYQAYGLTPEKNFKIGTIVSFMIHEMELEIQPIRLNQKKTLTYQGTWAHTKPRKFVVVELWKEHFVGLPIFTYGWKGLRNKVHKHEYMGIRDSIRCQDTVDESTNGNALVTRTAEYAGEDDDEVTEHVCGRTFRSLGELSYIHWTMPKSFFHSDRCYVEGTIDDQGDLDKLLQLYNSRFGEKTSEEYTAMLAARFTNFNPDGRQPAQYRGQGGNNTPVPAWRSTRVANNAAGTGGSGTSPTGPGATGPNTTGPNNTGSNTTRDDPTGPTAPISMLLRNADGTPVEANGNPWITHIRHRPTAPRGGLQGDQPSGYQGGQVRGRGAYNFNR